MVRKVFAAVLLAALCTAWPAQAQMCGAAGNSCVIASGTYNMSLPQAEPVGIVMHLHGGGGRGQGMLRSGLAQAALERGYIVVAPDGVQPNQQWSRDWSVRADGLQYDRNDSVFLRAVLADARARTGMSDGPVLLAGFSRGGSMTWDMACHDPSFADAYAPLAGAFWDALPDACTAPVNLFHTHGWTDRTVPLEGRSFRGGTVVQGDVWAALKIMRATNGCSNRQPEQSSFDGDQWLRHWTDCAEGDLHLLLHQGGHGAPSGWPTRILDWFEALPKAPT